MYIKCLFATELKGVIVKDYTRDRVLAVKDKDGNYYTGYNKWDKQLRKAKLYHSYKYAKEMVDDIRFIEHEAFMVSVDIIEGEIVDYEN